MSKVALIAQIKKQVKALSHPYKEHAQAPKLELAEMYLGLVAQKKLNGKLDDTPGSYPNNEIGDSAAADTAITIATALTLLQMGVEHHYRSVWPAIHAFLIAVNIDQDTESVDRAKHPDLGPPETESGLSCDEQISDIDLAIGDYFYASAIKEVSSLGLIDVIKASSVAIIRISSGYRKFDDIMQNEAAPGTDLPADICGDCGALYFLAHELAGLTPPARGLSATECSDLNYRSGRWFSGEVESHMKMSSNDHKITTSGK